MAKVMEVSEAAEFAAVHYVLPVHWASYLVNGDASVFEAGGGATFAEKKLLDDWIQSEGLGACIETSEQPFFTWNPSGPSRKAADCLEFRFLARS